jgi:hypothetical protein
LTSSQLTSFRSYETLAQSTALSGLRLDLHAVSDCGARAWGKHLRLATSVEAGVAVVHVGGGGLANSEGAQHHSGGATHGKARVGGLLAMRRS